MRRNPCSTFWSPSRAAGLELAVAVPPRDESAVAPAATAVRARSVASRLVLGSSDVFSGLFALRRIALGAGRPDGSASGSSLVLELLLRRPARCVDVPVAVDAHSAATVPGFEDLRRSSMSSTAAMGVSRG